MQVNLFISNQCLISVEVRKFILSVEPCFCNIYGAIKSQVIFLDAGLQPDWNAVFKSTFPLSNKKRFMFLQTGPLTSQLNSGKLLPAI